MRIIEVDEDTTAYEKGHIRGAVSWNWTTDLHTKVGRDYLDQAGFSGLLSDAGVGPDTTVVLYGGNNNWFAAYAYWLLKLRGFDNVKLLNGGRKKWELESRELTNDVPTYPSTGFAIAGPDRPEIRALRDEVIGKLGSSTGFVDVRSPEEYRARSSRPTTLRRSSRRCPATSPARPTSPGRRRPTTTARSSRPTSSRSSTRPRASRPTRGHRLLPDRGALVPHVVRAAGAARLRERQELRRLVDRVRLARGRARRDGVGRARPAEAPGLASDPGEGQSLPRRCDFPVPRYGLFQARHIDA